MDVNIISGKAYWASLTSPNTTFEPVWCVDVCLDEDTKSKVESLGLAVQNKGDDRGDFVKIKRKVNKKDGSVRPSPVIRDSQNNTWDAGKSGVASDLMGVQVVDLVSFGGDGSNFDAVDGGYTVGALPQEEGEEVPF